MDINITLLLNAIGEYVKENDIKDFLEKIKFDFDDVREAPMDFIRTYSVNQTKQIVSNAINNGMNNIHFDLDHDLGDYASQGGDAIKLIDWLLENYYDKYMNFTFHFHSMNPVGVANMRNAVHKYWEII